MNKCLDIQVLFAAVLAVGLSVSSPSQLSAQWQLQGSYSFLSGAPHNTIDASMRRTMGSAGSYSLTLRLGGEGGTDLYEGMYFAADTRVLRGYGILAAGMQINRLHLSGGVIGGIEHFHRTVESVGNVIPDLARPPDVKTTVPYVGGVVEVGYELLGPIRPFLAYRQEFVFHDRLSDQGRSELWSLRRHLRGIEIGIGMIF